MANKSYNGRSAKMEQIYDKIYRKEIIKREKKEKRMALALGGFFILTLVICGVLSVLISWRFMYVFMLVFNITLLILRIKSSQREQETEIETVNNDSHRRPYKK